MTTGNIVFVPATSANGGQLMALVSLRFELPACASSALAACKTLVFGVNQTLGSTPYITS